MSILSYSLYCNNVIKLLFHNINFYILTNYDFINTVVSTTLQSLF